MELQWNSSKVIKTQETYNQLISYSKEQQSGYPVIIAAFFMKRKMETCSALILILQGKAVQS